MQSTNKTAFKGRPVQAKRRPYILVAGSGEDTCTPEARCLALELGRELAQRRCIVVTGGLGGVMEAASKGAKEKGGTTVCILPGDNKDLANPFCDIVVATGLGHGRNFVNTNTADAVIVVGGGAGTLSEACFAQLLGKPVVALPASGGIAREIAGRRLDTRRGDCVRVARSPREAVDIVFGELERESLEEVKGS